MLRASLYLSLCLIVCSCNSTTSPMHTTENKPSTVDIDVLARRLA